MKSPPRTPRTQAEGVISSAPSKRSGDATTANTFQRVGMCLWMLVPRPSFQVIDRRARRSVFYQPRRSPGGLVTSEVTEMPPTAVVNRLRPDPAMSEWTLNLLKGVTCFVLRSLPSPLATPYVARPPSEDGSTAQILPPSCELQADTSVKPLRRNRLSGTTSVCTEHFSFPRNQSTRGEHRHVDIVKP